MAHNRIWCHAMSCCITILLFHKHNPSSWQWQYTVCKFDNFTNKWMELKFLLCKLLTSILYIKNTQTDLISFASAARDYNVIVTFLYMLYNIYYFAILFFSRCDIISYLSRMKQWGGSICCENLWLRITMYTHLSTIKASNREGETGLPIRM